jgi:tetratricopeptide (TPR) repeat protein
MQLSSNPSGSNFDLPDEANKLAIDTAAPLKPQIEIDLDRELAIEHNKRAHSNYDLQDYQVALASFDRQIELDPEDPHGYCYRGICYTQLKEYSRALDDFNIALKLKPGEPVFHHARGRTYQKLGNLSAALADYDLVIQTTALVRGHLPISRKRSRFAQMIFLPAIIEA